MEGFMAIIFFIILLGASAYLYYYFSNKNSNLRRQIIFLRRENENLRNNTKRLKVDNIIIKYLPFSKDNLIILKNCKLHISPIDSSPILNELEKDMEVTIHDKAEILGMIWYEISFPQEENVNSKGWIKSENILLNK